MSPRKARLGFARTTRAPIIDCAILIVVESVSAKVSMHVDLRRVERALPRIVLADRELCDASAHQGGRHREGKRYPRTSHRVTLIRIHLITSMRAH
jgi:hypothetical protein